jgi:hypothetical protein
MLFRLSMDLGTGAAGVLLGTAAALAPRGAALPFCAQPVRLSLFGFSGHPGHPSGKPRAGQHR